MPDFGMTLAKIRRVLGYSQMDLARLSGLSVTGICQIEQGRRDPRKSTVDQIESCVGPVTYAALTKLKKLKREAVK